MQSVVTTPSKRFGMALNYELVVLVMICKDASLPTGRVVHDVKLPIHSEMTVNYRLHVVRTT